MTFLVANLPPVHCWIRREFLYDFKSGHSEYEPCTWVTIKSLRSQAFRIESYLPRYAALYDKIPLHAYVSRITDLEPDKFLSLDTLQIWDCFSYDIAVIQKAFLRNLSCEFFAKDRQLHKGDYLFTVDNAAPDLNTLDTSYSEWPEDHKSFNFIQLNNGQYAAQPNNRCRFFDAASNPQEILHPDFKVATKKWVVETNPKWRLGDSDTVTYE